jgi:putative spermidine/putrescine transport system permease protein
MRAWLASPASETQVTQGQRLWLYALSGLIMLFLVAPTLIVIPMSFSESQYLEFPPRQWSVRWYNHYFGSPEWMSATATSLTAAFLTMLVATPIGILAAYGLHASNLRAGRLVFLLLITPMMVPVILVAIGAFYAYVKLKILYTMTGLVLAHSMLALPLVLIVVASALKSYDMNQEMAARSLGAPRWRAFLTVTLPQIRFAVITAALLAFLTPRAGPRAGPRQHGPGAADVDRRRGRHAPPPHGAPGHGGQPPRQRRFGPAHRSDAHHHLLGLRVAVARADPQHHQRRDAAPMAAPRQPGSGHARHEPARP